MANPTEITRDPKSELAVRKDGTKYDPNDPNDPNAPLEPARSALKGVGGYLDQLINEINRTFGEGLDGWQTEKLVERLENMRDDCNGTNRGTTVSTTKSATYPKIPGPFA